MKKMKLKTLTVGLILAFTGAIAAAQTEPAVAPASTETVVKSTKKSAKKHAHKVSAKKHKTGKHKKHTVS
jgi:Skp family chaperone for outer membrane proteins